MGKVDKEVIRIAAEAGAKAAIAQWENERAKAQEEKADRRLRNTRMLLKNFRVFKVHAENAVYEADQLDESVYDILDMMERNTSNLFVDSIKNSVARTATLVKHIDVMLGLYRVYCEQSGKPEDIRRWRIAEAMYISDHPQSIQELADQESVADRTIRRDIEEICEHLSGLFFGIDGIRKG